jgi:hypothetical protein
MITFDPLPTECGPPAPVRTWTVTLDTPQGQAQLDVPTSLGPDAAERRAILAAASLRWGDIDEIRVLDVVAYEGG